MQTTPLVDPTDARQRWTAGRTMVIALSLITGLAFAHEVRKGELTLAHPHIRVGPTCNTDVIRGFVMMIVNASKTPDRLLAAELEGYGPGRLMVGSGPAAKAAGPDGLEIAPGARAPLMPPAGHLEFSKPAKPLIEGMALKGTLTFARTGPMTVDFMLEAARDSRKPDDCGLGAASSSHGGHRGQ
jgi:copper(I)-binding protein